MPAAQAAILFVLVPLLMFDTVYQIFYFANNQVFYQHNARVAPNNRVAKNNPAMWLYEQGRYDAALAIFSEVAEKHPGVWSTVFNLGTTNYKLGRLTDAELDFARAIRINPAKADAHVYLGLTRSRMNRVEEAETMIRQAIRIRPAGYGYHFALGMVLKSRGKLREGLAEFRTELVNSPTEAAARQQVLGLERRLQQEEGLRRP